MVDASPLPATPTFCSVRMNGSGKGKVGRKKREGGRCRGWGRGGGYVERGVLARPSFLHQPHSQLPEAGRYSAACHQQSH